MDDVMNGVMKGVTTPEDKQERRTLTFIRWQKDPRSLWKFFPYVLKKDSYWILLS